MASVRKPAAGDRLRRLPPPRHEEVLLYLSSLDQGTIRTEVQDQLTSSVLELLEKYGVDVDTVIPKAWLAAKNQGWNMPWDLDDVSFQEKVSESPLRYRQWQVHTFDLTPERDAKRESKLKLVFNITCGSVKVPRDHVSAWLQ